ncbi:hypothetical protein ABK040_010887 [Willaertia magna]
MIKRILTILIILIAIYAQYVIYKSQQDSPPINPEDILKDGGKYVILKDNRILEYFVFGETENYTKTIVEFAGYGTTGRIFKIMENEQYKKRKIRGIAISVPGFGFSSIKVKRQLKDWHLDVDEVLKVEKVDKFWVKGQSFGTQHAMEIAHHYGKKRVSKLILITPFAPRNIAKELGTLNEISVPESDWLKNILFYFIQSMRVKFDSYKRLINDYPELERLTTITEEDIVRNLDHKGWKENNDVVCSDWGFDVREIDVDEVLIFYAYDDDLTHPKNAEWLIENIKNAKGFCSHAGYGHFSFAVPKEEERIYSMLE